MSAPANDGAPERVIELVAECLERLDRLEPGDRGGPRAAEAIEDLCRANPEHAEAIRERMGLLLRHGLAGDDGKDSRPRLRTLGRYRLVGELGRGGMGVVYLALDPKLGRLVALKALATRLVASDLARTRFEREIKAIAGLKHRRIVPIYEVGEAAGVPYFTMEFVEGKTLAQVVSALRDLDVPTDELNTTHLGAATFLEVTQDLADPASDSDELRAVQAQPPSDDDSAPGLPTTWGKTYVETVCRLVLDVADALQHAHSHGVVHRDVKPSNVLLANDGRALLFDFGLARMDFEDTMTLTGDFAGTPYYVAPEQIAARGKGVDGRSDVYALGVTLFELLTLRRPFEGKNPQAIFRQVLTKDPPLLRKFNRLVPRDLETVCLAALEKDPAKRYQSAAELAADLRRFLEFRPVRARPIGFVTRTGRLVRRHPGAAAAIALGALILIGVPVGLGAANIQIAEEADRARQAEARAERAADRARAVNDFLIEMLAAADPGVAGAPGIGVRELLDVSSREVGAMFPDQPEVEAEVRRTIGNTYAALGRYDDAQPHLERALELRRAPAEPDEADVAESLYDLGECLHLKGEHKEAEAALTDARRMREAYFEGDSDEVAQSLAGLAALLADVDRVDEARDLFQRSLDMRTRLYGREHKKVVAILLALGKLALWRDDLATADDRFREALELATSLFGERDLTVANVEQHLGSLQRMIGDYREAQDLWERALATRREVLGDDHLQTAMLMVNLSRVARILGDPERAEALAREGIAVQEPILGPDHVDLTYGLMSLGMALLALEEFDEGRRTLERAVGLHRKWHGRHPDTAMALFDLGRFVLYEGDDDYAAEVFAEALGILEETRDADSRLLGNMQLLYGETQRRRGELEHAEELLAEAYRVHQIHLDAGAPTLVMNKEQLGIVKCMRGKHEEALPLLEHPYRVYRGMSHDLPEAALSAALWIGKSLTGLDRVTEAEEHYVGALEYARGMVPDGSAEYADVLDALAQLYLETERPADAAPLLELAVDMGPRVAPDAHQAHAETSGALGFCYARLGRFEEAEPLLLASYERLAETVGLGDEETRKVLAGLLELYQSWGKPAEEERWKAVAEAL